MARELTTEFKVSARTAPETYEAIGHEVVRSISNLKFRGRKVGVEAVLNAIVLDFLAREPEERSEILEWGVRQFEGQLASDTPRLPRREDRTPGPKIVPADYAPPPGATKSSKRA